MPTREEELVEAIMSMDYAVCGALNDEEGQTEAVQILRQYERVILALFETEKVFRHMLGIQPGDWDKQLFNWRMEKLARAIPWEKRWFYLSDN